MPIVSTLVLKAYFNTGDTPTEAQYIDLIDTLAALPASASLKWQNLSHADGLAVVATFFGSGTVTLAKNAAGDYTVTFPAALTPMGLTITGDSDNLDGTGQITVRIANSGSYYVRSTLKLQRADNFDVISDPKGEMSIEITETVSSSTTIQVFTNMNNFPVPEGWVITEALVSATGTDNNN